MSRKNKSKQAPLPIDTGGLDLDKFAVVPDGQLPPEQTVAIAPESRAHAAVEELESLPPSLPVGAEIVSCNAPVHGFCLSDALSRSPYLRLAARPTSNEQVVIASNGVRFWAAARQGLNPSLALTFDRDAEAARMDWRPVLGNEKGLYIA